MEVRELPIGSVKDLPSTAGVYWVLAGESVLYVGQSANLWQRWASHHRIVDMRQLSADLVRWVPVERDRLLAVELELISELRPVLNGRPGRSVTMRIGGALLERIDAQADAEHISRSAVIHRALRVAFPEHERTG